MQTLPISVILPTLNCRPKLSGHLKLSQEWLGNVSEIIVVDSSSNDGSLEFLRETLKPYDATFIRTEPGLYASWNRGVQESSQPFVYFSTIGDTIYKSGLEQLHEWCEHLNLDVAISTPLMERRAREPVNVIWPIHELGEFLKRRGDIFVPEGTDLEMLARVFVPECILGSSASNLYRASALRQFPWPESAGNQGDVLWAANYLPKLKVGISPKQFSVFMYDGDRKLTYRQYANTVSRLEIAISKAAIAEKTLAEELSAVVVKQRRRLANRLSRLTELQDTIKYIRILEWFFNKLKLRFK